MRTFYLSAGLAVCLGLAGTVQAKEYHRYKAYPGEGQAVVVEPEIKFGDNSAPYSFDGECDDPRFKGEGMARTLLTTDRGRDAADCQSLYEAGKITFAGAPVVLSQKTNLVVVEPAHDLCDNPDGLAFNIAVSNRTDLSFEVSHHRVTVHHGHTLYPVLSAAEFREKKEREARRQKILTMAIGAAGAVAEVRAAANTGVYTGNLLMLTMTAPGAIDTAMYEALDHYRNVLMEPQTIGPGEMHGGWVTIGDNLEGKAFKFRTKEAAITTRVTVSASGEFHEFEFGCEL